MSCAPWQVTTTGDTYAQHIPFGLRRVYFAPMPSPSAPRTDTQAPAQTMPVPVRIGGLSGWLHGHGPRAVLMCGAHGFEGHSAYQSWRILADLIAANGCSVLRFDYPGEGDSADVPAGTSRLAAAATSITEAADWLITQTGAGTLDIVCLRLGALLAARALGAGPLARSVLLAPQLNGKAYVRELKAAARLFGSSPGRAGVEAEGGIALCGFSVSAQDVAELAACSLQAPAASASFIALTTGQTLPMPAGSVVTTFDDYGAMISLAEGNPPLALWQSVAGWMGAGPVQPEPRPILPSAVLPSAVLAGAGWRETALRFGPGDGLAGVLCEPASAPARNCIVLPNAGGNPHFGWARMSVDHGRALAQAGVASFRFDLSGIGDSTWHPASVRRCLYGRAHLEDMRCAVDLVVDHGYAPMVSGLCSGGYLALHAMHADPRITRGVAVNVLKLIWHPDDDLDTIERQATQAARSYGSKALSGSAWKRLLAGEIGRERIAAVAGLLARRALRRLCETLGLETGLPEDTRLIRSILRDISARGAALTFVHGEMDASRDEADLHFGTDSRHARTLPGISIEIIPDTDHEFTPKAARDRLLDLLIDRAR